MVRIALVALAAKQFQRPTFCRISNLASDTKVTFVGTVARTLGAVLISIV